MAQTLPEQILFKMQRNIHIMCFNRILQAFILNHLVQNLFPCLAKLAVNYSCIMIHVLVWYHAIAYSDHCLTTVTLQEKYFFFPMHILEFKKHVHCSGEMISPYTCELQLQMVEEFEQLVPRGSLTRAGEKHLQQEALNCGCLSNGKLAFN